MAPLAMRSQSAGLQLNGSNGTSFVTSRSAIGLTSQDDPLQPLRAMADRVGKEVEKFAVRVDHWHTHGNESDKTKYQTTLRMVNKFKDLADSTVKEIKKQSDDENRGELQQSVRRRIQSMAEEEPLDPQGNHERSFPSVVPSIETSSIPPSTRVQELRHWQTEAATWELLRIIIEHYHPEPGTDVAAEKRSRLAKVGGAYRYSPNSEIWDRFSLEDDHAKEKVLVLRWLERTARNSESDIESITEQLEAESGKDTHTWTTGWLDTKAKIKQAKRMQGFDRPLAADHAGLKSKDQTQTLISQLDPDAPGRQQRTLEKSDEYYERALWMVCYEMLRRGVSWEEISEWCKERNEGWRGVSIGAAYESHPEGGPNVAGPTVGYLFRRMCFYAAKGARTQYESAVYGLLTGDLREVEPVCRSWDDHLYARYNGLLLSRFDEYLLDNHSHRISQSLAHKFVLQDAVANLGNWQDSSRRVIDILKQQKSTAALSSLPMKLIQGSLIGRTVDDLIYRVGVAIAMMLQDDVRPTRLVLDPDADQTASPLRPKPKVTDAGRRIIPEKYYQTLATDPHALRVLVHMFIVLRKGLGLFNMDEYHEWAGFDNVTVAYIEFLRITKRIQLIPLYAAQLDGSRPVHCLARVLPDIRNPEEQKSIIGLMEQYKIDPVEVISQNYQLISQREFGSDAATYISRFEVLEQTTEIDYLWPGRRIKSDFAGTDIEPKEETLIESLRWQTHLSREIHSSFENLQGALIYLLLHGRIGAAETIIQEMSVDALSHVKTEALCGYAFDFTVPGSEQQDESQVTHSGRSSLRPSNIPSAAEHAHYVLTLRDESQVYFDLQQLVHLIILFRQWREEEDDIIQQRGQGVPKVSLKKVKDLFETIETTLFPLLDSFVDTLDDSPGTDVWLIKKAYIPEVILGYISIVQAAAYFTNRDLTTKAMEMATIVADEDRKWIQRTFLETGRMTELVDALARVSKAMLKLGEAEIRGRAPAKKRGSRGESLRIWDVNMRN